MSTHCIHWNTLVNIFHFLGKGRDTHKFLHIPLYIFMVGGVYIMLKDLLGEMCPKRRFEDRVLDSRKTFLKSMLDIHLGSRPVAFIKHEQLLFGFSLWSKRPHLWRHIYTSSRLKDIETIQPWLLVLLKINNRLWSFVLFISIISRLAMNSIVVLNNNLKKI